MCNRDEGCRRCALCYSTLSEARLRPPERPPPPYPRLRSCPSLHSPGDRIGWDSVGTPRGSNVNEDRGKTLPKRLPRLTAEPGEDRLRVLNTGSLEFMNELAHVRRAWNVRKGLFGTRDHGLTPSRSRAETTRARPMPSNAAMSKGTGARAFDVGLTGRRAAAAPVLSCPKSASGTMLRMRDVESNY